MEYLQLYYHYFLLVAFLIGLLYALVELSQCCCCREDPLGHLSNWQYFCLVCHGRCRCLFGASPPPTPIRKLPTSKLKPHELGYGRDQYRWVLEQL